MPIVGSADVLKSFGSMCGGSVVSTFRVGELEIFADKVATSTSGVNLCFFPGGISLCGPQFLREEVFQDVGGVSTLEKQHLKVRGFPGTGAHAKWLKQVIKKYEKPLFLVVSEDVSMNDIILMKSITLVAHFGGRKFI